MNNEINASTLRDKYCTLLMVSSDRNAQRNNYNVQTLNGSMHHNLTPRRQLTGELGVMSRRLRVIVSCQ